MPKLKWITALAAGVLAANLNASPTVLHGTVIDAADLFSMKVGVYEFNSESYQFTPVVNSFTFNATGGVVIAPGNRYLPIVIDDYSEWGMGVLYSMYDYNTTTWTSAGQYTPDASAQNTTTAVNPATGAIYGCFKQDFDATTWYFGSFSTSDMSSTRIVDLATPWLACDFADDGNLYAIDRNGTLSTVNLSTGALTTVAQTGITADAIGSGAIDRVTGIFYVANRENLYAVNLATHHTSVVYPLENSQQIVGMYVAQNATLAAKPGMVTDLKASVSSTQCTVTFTMPSTDEYGAAITGKLSYSISDNGKAADAGEANAGQMVSRTIALEGSGVHAIEVVASLNGVAGEAAATNVTVSGRPDYALLPPYVQTFDDEAAFNTMVVNDANKDNWKWIYWNHSAYSQFSSAADSDDYLLTPTLWLEAGNTYRFSCEMWQRDVAYDEYVEIVYGTSQNPSDLKPIATYHLTDGQHHTESVVIPITETGVYHVGLHQVSPKNGYGIYADNFDLSAGSTDKAPAAQLLAVQAAADGSLSATIGIMPQFVTESGAPCSISSIELFRSGTLVKTFTNVQQGQTLQYTDRVDSAGVYTWSVVAVNRYGRSFDAKASTFVGVNVPGSPTGFVARETNNFGEVEFSWEAPVVDKDGNPFTPALARYMLVYRLSNGGIRIIKDDISGTSYKAVVKQPGEAQEFMSFVVCAKSDAGTNDWDGASTEVMAIGMPYAMPYNEPFGTSDPTYVTTSSSPSSKWEIRKTAEDHDGNGQFLFFNCYRSHSGDITTGKIAVSGTSPALMFWYLCLPEATDVITVEISVDGSEFATMQTICIGDGDEQTWKSAVLSLKDYIGKTVRVRLSYTCSEYHLGIDDLSVVELAEYDLCASAISVPLHARPGTDVPVKVAVENVGASMAEVFFIDLYRNGELLSSRIEQNLEPNTSKWYSFYDMFNVFDTENRYYAVVTLDGDSNASNDRTAEVTLGIEYTDLPAPQRLTAKATDAGVVLNCHEPAFDLAPVAVSDGVEDYKSFSIGLAGSQVPDDNIGDWSTVDADGLVTAIITQNDEYAIFPNANKPMSFIVFDVKNCGLSEKYHYKFLGHNSDKCFMAITSVVRANDDWLISPMLSGEAQTVRFFAKSAVDSYGLESFELLASSTDKKCENFTLVKPVSDVPTEWTEYTFDVPEGTKYFAIRYNATGRYAFLVDDFTFEAASRDAQLALKGYKVYRDHKLIATLTSGSTFTDIEGREGDVYHATAIYKEGESNPTAEAVASGIDAVDGDSALHVTVELTSIHIDNPAGDAVMVCDALGRVISPRSTDVRQHIAVAPGIYLISNGTTTIKAIVR